MTVELFPVTPRLLSSTPSTVKLLSRGRVPPTDPPMPVTPPGCAITLGASTARFSRLPFSVPRSEEHTSELQSHSDLVCRLLLEKKKKKTSQIKTETT